MNPICGNCHIEMKTITTGATVASEENPTWVRAGDLVECPKCSTSVVVNMGEAWTNPIEAQIKVVSN